MSIIQGHAKSSGVTSFYPTTIDQSLRFEDGDSAYLSRTPASAGNRKTWTLSAWVKKGNVTEQTLLDAYSDDNNRFILYLNNGANGQLRIFERVGGSSNMGATSAGYYRDPSAWYHIVVALDTTQATASNRLKIYINGEQISFSSITYPSQNYEPFINAAVGHSLSSNADSGGREKYYDGYMAEVHFTDGTAYTADDFGELKSGIWVPKSPSVTYGTNGFKLTFGDSAAIGDDTSGNGNDWTVNNLVASDVVLDSPTNNFGTMNALYRSFWGAGVLSEGNLKWYMNGDGVGTGTFFPSTGKWYFEVYKLAGSGNNSLFGIIEESNNGYLPNNKVYYRSTGGDITNFGTTVSTGLPTLAASGDVVGVAYDLDTGDVEFFKNGVSLGSTTIASGNLGKGFGVYLGNGNSNSADAKTFILNCGQDSTFAGNTTAGGNSDANGIGDFKYAPPSGYLALCTSNLPDPAIDPAQDNTPQDHFDILTSAGTSSYSGLSFAPDFLWNKIRTAVGSNVVADVIRGDDKRLRVESTNAEDTLSGFFNLTSNGFTTTAYNSSGEDYVYWFWKAGGTGVSNTDGSITSTVSANTDAGFSIVGYNGTQVAGDSVGHGLAQAPEMIIVKKRGGAASNWMVYHKGVASDAATDHLHLNLADAAVDSSADWNDQAPTSSVFYLGNGTDTNDGGSGGIAHIAYCFHSVDGFSKVGSYEGNNSTDGTFVYTGFRPKWVLIKHADSTGNWTIFDAERSTYNLVDDQLLTNSTNAEKVQAGVDFLSNGFKLRVSGVADFNNTDTYIYLAFAEQPAKYSNAR